MKIKSHPLFLALTLSILSAAATPCFAGEAASDANQPARPLATVAPTYPYLLRHAGATGEVTVAFTVDARGAVTRAQVVDTTNVEFNAPTLAAITQWNFAPARKDGQAVATQVKQTFYFNLRVQPEVSSKAMLAAKQGTR